MKEIQLHEALVTDLAYLAEVCESVVPLYQPIMPGAFERQAERFRTAQRLPAEYRITVIRQEGERVGFLGVRPLREDILYLVALYIHAGHQQKGIGSAVMKSLCRKAEEQGCREILLLAHEKAEWAIRFYQRHDFVLVSADWEEISEYGDGLLAGIVIPQTVLMSRHVSK